MKTYLVSLAVGLLVGGIYALLNVKSPAPPYIALLGLLGIVLGEKAVLSLKPGPAVVASQVAHPTPAERSKGS